MNHTQAYVQRVAEAIPEARLDLGLSQRQLARFADMSASTVSKLEAGGCVSPSLVLRLAAVLVVLELHRPVEDDSVDMVCPTATPEWLAETNGAFQ